MTSKPRLESAVATGKGDDGTTGLLYGGDRIRKEIVDHIARMKPRIVSELLRVQA